MDSLKFDEELHIYKYGNCIIPSVTQVLSILSDDIYGNIDIKVLKKASEKGSKVHYRTEIYDLYKVNEEDEETNGYMQAYLKFLNDYNAEPLLIEQKIYHPKLLYAGTLDRLFKINGKNVLVDIKTTKVIYSKLVELQDTAYAMCVDILYPQYRVDDIAVLQLKENGEYEFVILKRNDALFLSIYRTYNVKKTLIEGK